jgi:hypothetical protein
MGSLINHLNDTVVGQDFISVGSKKGVDQKNNQGHVNKKNLGKGPPLKVL